MPRTKGSKNIKKAHTIKPIKEPEMQVEIVDVPEEKPIIQESSGIEDRPFFSVDEAARYLGVRDYEARLWFDHGHLKGTNDQGFIRISRESILRVRRSKLIIGPMAQGSL